MAAHMMQPGEDTGIFPQSAFRVDVQMSPFLFLMKHPTQEPVHVMKKAYSMSEALAIRHGVENPTRMIGRDEPLEPGAVRAQLERILGSKTFSRSPRISRFLTFVVEQTLAGQEDKLKEYLLGVEVFNRLDSFDPRIDSIVRVEARRLRYKLERYYESEGQSDPVFIQFRKGCYVPGFSNRSAFGDDLLGVGMDVPHLHVIGNAQAFGLFARGRYSMARWTPEGVDEAISCFTQAIDEDPDCVGAYSGLGAAWMIAGLLGFRPASEVMPKARERAEQAIVLRPNLPEPHSVLGLVRASYEWEWNDAEPLLRRGIQFAPHDPVPRLWYGLYSALAGRSDRAIHESHRGQQTSPTSLSAHMAMGFACHMAGNLDDAVIHYRLAQDLDPTFYPAHLGLGLIFADQDVSERALESLSESNRLRPSNPLTLAALTYAHARAGHNGEAIRFCNELESLRGSRYVPPVARAVAAGWVSDFAAASAALDEALEERSPWLACVHSLRAFEPLRQTEAYSKVAAALRLPHAHSLVA